MTGHSVGPAESFAFNSPALRVLVVDDNETNRQVMAIVLAPICGHLSYACDGLQAVEAWEAQNFDLILMDLQMPVMDGNSATKTIRMRETNSSRRRTPILIVSANCAPLDIKQARAAGADDHMEKPITVTTLFEKISAALKNNSGRTVSGHGGFREQEYCV